MRDFQKLDMELVCRVQINMVWVVGFEMDISGDVISGSGSAVLVKADTAHILNAIVEYEVWAEQLWCLAHSQHCILLLPQMIVGLWWSEVNQLGLVFISL